MKKIFFFLFLCTFYLTVNQSVKAQAPDAVPLKVGIFDLDRIVQAMPGYAKVDSALQLYSQDSLKQEYAFYQDEFQRLDSTFKADSAKGKVKVVLDQIVKQRQEVGLNLVYWQQIQQNKVESKRQQLAQPLYEAVAIAYKKVLEANKITLVLKPESLELGTNEKVVTDLLTLVAKELKIPFGQADLQADDVDKPQPGATKPASKAASKGK